MKEKHNVTLYSCDFCNIKMQIKNAMIRHEKVCTKNPDNFIACSGCNNCQEVKKDILIYNAYYGEYQREVKSFFCKALEKNMYPPKAQILAFQYPENFEDEIMMPKECEFKYLKLPF